MYNVGGGFLLTITVSQLNRYLKATLEENDKLRDLYVRGEVVGFVRHSGSGHCYFRLVDEHGSVKAVLFRQQAELLGFEPGDGMAVLARCSLGVYERDGVYQLYVRELLPVGEGALAVALAQRKAKLEKMGVFDPARKKPLPPYPNRIGVATSANGAALQDIAAVIKRRFPAVVLVHAPTLVQGEQAPATICAALTQLDSADCGVIILARGGGSKEDLSVFDEESVVLSVFACKTPLICAVGHQTDYTLCDYAADARAPTPSAAAELATPDKGELSRQLSEISGRFSGHAVQLIKDYKVALGALSSHPALRSPHSAVNKSKEKLDIYTKTLYNSTRIIMHRHFAKLGRHAAQLDSLSPLKVLERGYCLTIKDKQVSTAAKLSIGDQIDLRFGDGQAKAEILEVRAEL